MFDEINKKGASCFYCGATALEDRGVTGEIITSARDLWEGSTLRRLKVGRAPSGGAWRYHLTWTTASPWPRGGGGEDSSSGLAPQVAIVPLTTFV